MSKIKGKYIDFNDTGTGTSDVWSADKIISYVDAFNPFDQDLNTTDDVEFQSLITDYKLQCGSWITSPNINNGLCIGLTTGNQMIFRRAYPSSYDVNTIDYTQTSSGSGPCWVTLNGRFMIYKDEGLVENRGSNSGAIPYREYGEFRFLLDSNFKYSSNTLYSPNVNVSGTITGNVTATDLDVTGAVDFSSTLNVDGAVDFNSTLTIDGLTTIYNNLDVQDDLDVGGTITGNVTGNLTGNISGNSTVSGDLNVTGATDLNSSLNVDGDTSVQKLTVGGYLTLNSRLLLHESTIGNAADVALGSGNMFSPTYSSLNRISSSSWTTGSVIYLVFTGSCTVSSSATTSGNYKGLRLAGTATFSAKAGDTLTLIYDGTYWRETSRMVS